VSAKMTADEAIGAISRASQWPQGPDCRADRLGVVCSLMRVNVPNETKEE
jgi:hypothetical protein